MKIDEWLPEYQVSSRYSIIVRASREQTQAALAKSDFSRLPIVRGLMRLRGYRLGSEKRKERDGGAPGPTEASGQYGSFLTLATVPQEEALLGIAGRFWRPDGGIVRGLTPEEFRSFRRDGFARAVWNFSLSSAQGGTLLSTETRVQTFGRAATIKFRLYWLAVGSFSGVIRKSMLREVRRIAEQSIPQPSAG